MYRTIFYSSPETEIWFALGAIFAGIFSVYSAMVLTSREESEGKEYPKERTVYLVIFLISVAVSFYFGLSETGILYYLFTQDSPPTMGGSWF